MPIKIITLSYLVFVSKPVFAANITTFADLVDFILVALNSVIPVVFGLALVAFLWGVTKTILSFDSSPKAIAEARNFMIYGILGMFVMVSVWGLVYFVKNTFFSGAPLPFDQNVWQGGAGTGSFNLNQDATNYSGGYNLGQDISNSSNSNASSEDSLFGQGQGAINF
jgi:hypothetical protein